MLTPVRRIGQCGDATRAPRWWPNGSRRRRKTPPEFFARRTGTPVIQAQDGSGGAAADPTDDRWFSGGRRAVICTVSLLPFKRGSRTAGLTHADSVVDDMAISVAGTRAVGTTVDAGAQCDS